MKRESFKIFKEWQKHLYGKGSASLKLALH